MPNDTESNVLVGLCAPLVPGSAPTVMLGMTPASFDVVRGGLTHTFDLTKVGIPVQIVIFGDESHAELASLMQQLAEAGGAKFVDQRGKGGKLPNLGIDDPTTH